MDFEIFRLHHRGKDCIGVRLSKEDTRTALVRKIPVIRWSQTNTCWYGEYTAELKYLISMIFGEEKAAAVAVAVVAAAAVGGGGSQVDEVESGSRQVDEVAAVGGGGSQVDEVESGSRQVDEVAAVGGGGSQVDEVESGGRQVDEVAADGGGGRQVDELGGQQKVVLSASVLEAVEKFKEHMRVIRYAENSIQNYTSAVIEFLNFFIDEDWKQLNATDMQRFQKERIIDRNLSYSYQNTMISAIKRFYEVNTGKAVDPDFIKRPRKGHPLPNIFSLEQVAKLLKSVKNQKHRMMLSVGYGCGLRSGEVIKLKPEDIHSDQGMLAILQSKGNKDRMIPISANLISQLREYFKIYKPKVWLFEGEKEGERYSQRSLQLVFRKALERCKFSSKHKFHDLRHSYATHLMDAGTNQHVIQKVLGHKNIKTTEIYTHVSKTLLQKIYNPFDNLNM